MCTQSVPTHAPDADGSQLVLAFFRDTLDDPINDIVRDAVRTLDWESLAEDHRNDPPVKWFDPDEEWDEEGNSRR